MTIEGGMESQSKLTKIIVDSYRIFARHGKASWTHRQRRPRAVDIRRSVWYNCTPFLHDPVVLMKHRIQDLDHARRAERSIRQGLRDPVD